MKHLYKISLVVGIIAVTLGCEDKFEAPSDTPNNIHITTGYGTGTPIVQINGQETFADLSVGVVSREWTFPGGEITDVSNSQDQLVPVTFKKTGSYEVKIEQTYADNPWDWRTEQFTSTKDNDSTLTVTVVDSVSARMQVFYVASDGSDSTELVLQSGAANQLMAGESIRIKQNSGGVPTIFEYTSEGASPASTKSVVANEAVDIKYKRLGSYDLTFKPYRTKPAGEDFIVLKDFIEVIPSTKPVVLESVIRYADNAVGLVYSRSIAEPSGAESNFSVRAINIVRSALGIPRDFDEFLPVEAVTVAPGDDDNILLIQLGDKLYNSDTVFVSYDGAGSVNSTDGIQTSEFSNKLLDFQLVNIAAQYGGFENEGEGWKQHQEFNDDGTIKYRNDAGYGTFEFSTEKPYSGGYSLKLSTKRDADDNAQWSEVISNVDLEDPNAAQAYNAVAVEEGDKFYISYYAFVEWTQPIGPDTWEASSFYLWLMGDKLQVLEYREGVATHPKNQWVKVEGLWGGVNGASSSATLRPYFRSIGNITIFLDDLVITRYETRPGF
ncbi:MAG: hypothetical protein JXQ90_10920 [Cyclobacteriaceae bacterium]